MAGERQTADRSMPEHAEHRNPSRRPKAEMVERLVGLSRQHDEEDIAYWRNASDETRGRTLYHLLLLVHAIGHYPDKPDMFPGFPRRAKRDA